MYKHHRGGADNIGAFILSSPLTTACYPHRVKDIKESRRSSSTIGESTTGDVNSAMLLMGERDRKGNSLPVELIPSDILPGVKQRYIMLSYSIANTLIQLGFNIQGATFAL